ncbi:MAG: phosphate ABC transporter substrate-binding protein [Myxococcales bacterium]|nr:phosphate ABC transporter substrate-binding protein [Myxococcales bacterium]
MVKTRDPRGKRAVEHDDPRALSRREALSLLGLAGAAALPAWACSPSNNVVPLRISGSNTVYTYALELAKKYRERHANSAFRITGDGTSRGIKFAGEGEVQGLPADFSNRNKANLPEPAGGTPNSSNGERMDIGIASRGLFQSEREAYSAMVETPFAYDGIAVVTNRNISVPNLTVDQLRRIYAGMIRNWNEVGGPNAPIVVIARDMLAGTAEAWSELVMNGLPVMANMMISMAEDVPAAVVANANSIAYLALAQIDAMMMNPVSIDTIAPTIENVASGRYPIKRPFIFVTGGRPTTTQAEFIDFAFSAEGQAVIRTVGAVPATRAGT